MKTKICKACIKNESLDCIVYEGESFFCSRSGGITSFEKALTKDLASYKEDWYSFSACPKQFNPYYIHFIRKYVSTLDRNSQVAYYHYISNIPKKRTSALLGMFDFHIDRVLKMIYDNSIKFFKEEDVFNENLVKYRSFLNLLLNPKIDDDEIAEKSKEDIATIKIARAFALRSQGLVS